MFKPNASYKKVLVIGSGPIVIGQAAEFDYAGTQACLTLKEEGIEIVLVNNNPATIMTDEEIADTVYFEPLNLESLKAIIEKEQPDGLLASMGGQTALNLALKLAEAGVLDKYSVNLLGTSILSIQKGEDRELFKQTMEEINEPVPASIITKNIEDAICFAKECGYPIIVRPAYTLGGTGGGKAENENELRIITDRGLKESPIGQVLIDKSLLGWKEIEYEVMRDSAGNSIIVCNMENIDPMGIHTGDSIVVAPSQTLNDTEYQMLRTSSLKVIDALGIVGGCNIQFALHPNGKEYSIIEVNPRVSRSSALASKATGYPIARIATKLALGHLLHEIKNPITKNTFASFEPTLDYIVVKMPRFPFDKFPYINRKLGTQMKATGEIMTIDRSFERALYKAIRALEISKYGLLDSYSNVIDNEKLELLIKEADDRRLFLVAEAFARGIDVETIHKWSSIDWFFLNKINGMVQIEKSLLKLGKEDKGITKEELIYFKKHGLSDKLISKIIGISYEELWKDIKELNISPCYKAVDTCAGEFEASTPYFYSCSHGKDDEPALAGKKVAILSSGAIRIGQGIEFDYCAVHTALALQEDGIQSIVINNNPETVSTDYQMSSRLYMEPLVLEDILPILEKEKVDGVIYQVGGQTSLKLAKELESYVNLLGTPLSLIDEMEDREKFNKYLTSCGVEPIPGKFIWDKENIDSMDMKINFPFLIRPSYVIGGQWMRKINNSNEFKDYVERLESSLNDKSIYPLLIDKFIEGKEVEVDVISDGEDWLVPAIMEHIEPAGIHSGDSTAVLPPFTLTEKQKNIVSEIIEKIMSKGNFIGLVNIQMIVQNNNIYVLEINPRASRTVPVISKVTGVPMIVLATKVQLGESLKSMGYPLGLLPENNFFTVKSPVFSNNKLPGINQDLGPEMKSTGEIMSLGWTLDEALEKIDIKVHGKLLVPRDLKEYRKLIKRGAENYA